MNESTEPEFRDILGGDDFDFRYDCGISQPVSRISFFDRVNAFALHYCIIRVKAELDQLIKGLEVYQAFHVRCPKEKNSKLTHAQC